MPQQPDAGFAPDIDIDDSVKWRLKLVDIDEQPSKFTDRRKDAKTLVHKWTVHDMTHGVAVTDDTTGDLYEQWQFVGDATYDNPTTGKIAPAREIANALIGHRLSDDEVREMIREGWKEALIGRSVIADLEWYQRPDGAQRLRVLRVKPDRIEKRKLRQVEVVSNQVEDDDD